MRMEYAQGHAGKRTMGGLPSRSAREAAVGVFEQMRHRQD